MTMLAQPASRFNWFGYTSDTDSLSFSAKVASNSIAAESAPTDPTDTSAQAFNLSQISALREIGGLSSGGGAMGDLIRKVRGRNKDFRDQAIASGKTQTLRQLWLGIVLSTLSEDYAQKLASAIQMEVVIYPDEIIFKPEFTTSPPVIQKRGVISLGVLGTDTEDVHTLDSQGNSFDP